MMSMQIQDVLTVDSQPLVLIFTLWKLHNFPKAASAQCSLRILSQLVARSAFSRVSRSKLISSPLVAIIYL